MTEATINTIEKPGEFDALVKLRPGEPYFALLGRDPKAVPLILTWAQMQREWAMTLPKGKRRDKQLRKATQAEEIAWAMEQYHDGTLEVPVPEATRKPYTGVQLPAATVESDKRHSALIGTVRTCHNSLAELMEQAGKLAPYDRDTAQAMEEIAERLRTIANNIDAQARPALEARQ